MTVITKRSGILNIDENLRRVAENLLQKYPDELGHIDLNHVILCRSEAVKLKKKSNWLGKCIFLQPETRIQSFYSIKKLIDLGLLDKNNLVGLEDEVLDFKYIITLNSVAIEDIGVKPIEVIEEIILHHELLHIAPNMDGNIQHNIQDFSWILDRYGVHWTQGVLPEECTQTGNEFIEDFTDRLQETGARLSMNMPDGGSMDEVE